MAEPFIGEIRLFSFGFIPKGWAPCNGQILPINSNQALYSVLGNKFGGDGISNFALPDLRGRTPVHMSENYPIATAGGEAQHVLTIQEIPAHTHQVYGDTTLATLPSPANNVWGATGSGRPIYASAANTTMNEAAIGTTGSSQAHDNMQPYSVVSFCIALQGIYPSKS